MFAIIETERSGWQKGDRKDRLDPAIAPDDDEQNRGNRAAARPTGARRHAAVPTWASAREGDDGKWQCQSGAILSTVTEGGGAEKAGLKAGDRITAIDDEAGRRPTPT